MKLIFEYFDQIHAIKGRNEKIRLIEELIAEVSKTPALMETLREILQYTYDPYITFGVTVKDPKLSLVESLNDEDLAAHWIATKALFDRLASRELSGRAATTAVQNILTQIPMNIRKWYVGMFNRNLRIAGVAASTWAKYVDGLTNAISPQLCDKFDNRTIDTPFFCEPKYDGIRAVFIPRDDGTVIALSREGKPINNVEHICAAIAKADANKIVLDGELFVRDFHTTQSITSTQTPHPEALSLVFYAFDAIPIDEWDAQEGKIPLYQRKQILAAVVDEINGIVRPAKNPTERVIQLSEEDEPIVARELSPERSSNVSEIDESSFIVRFVPCRLIGSNASSEALFRKAVASGFEGIILKEHDCPYIFKRSKRWMKVKPTADADLPIIDAIEGEERLVGSLGALVLQGTVMFNNRPHKVTTKVGTGFTDVQRKELWEAHQRGELIGRIVQVSYQEPDIDGALRFPSFERLRDDRAEESVTDFVSAAPAKLEDLFEQQAQ